MTITAEKIIPQELRNRNQWVLWNLEKDIDKKTGKQKINKDTGELLYTKVPYQLNGNGASSTDEKHLVSYEDVVSHQKNYSGIGYVLNEHDPYTAIDLDDCIIDGEITDEAKRIVESLNSFTEISQSGTGLHIFVKGSKPGSRCKNSAKGFEMYDKNRFMIMTGNHLEGTPVEINEAQEIINYLYDIYFPKNIIITKENKEVQQSPQLPDNEVIKIATNAKNGDKVKALLNGDISTYGSQSEAELALCNIIAFYTQDVEQIDRIVTNSEMYRDKWDREDYKTNTIEMAINDLTATFQKKATYQINFQEDDTGSEKINKGAWWYVVPDSGKTTFLHSVMAQYVLQENKIVRYPDEDGDLYIYNDKTGIYEVDKTSRRTRSIIRNLEILKNNPIREVRDYIADMSDVIRSESTDYVAVNNGLIDLKNMELVDYTPDVFLTKKIPTNYNKNAHNEFVDETLRKVSSGHEPTIKNICEMFGAVLYPRLLVPKMFYLYGRSAHNGKSTILFMIQKTFNSGNDISAISPQKLAENTFAGSSIYGKLANIVDDLPGEVIEDSGTLKTVITGGYVDIEAKGQDSQTVQMNTVCITASNHYPNFKEHGNQINKRLYIMPFDYDFTTDPDCISEPESMAILESKSAREYVLKLAVDALKEMTNRTGEVLTHNEKVEEATQSFSEYSDPLADFFSEYDKDFFEGVRGTDALEEYSTWCKDNHIQHPLGHRRFKDAVNTKYNMEWKDKSVKINGHWRTVKGFKSKND